MDYLKSALPSQIMSERGSNLVVINPGSANVRIGLASQDTPFNIPHCIARNTEQIPNFTVIDKMLNITVTTQQHIDREKAYDVIAPLLKIPFLDEEGPSNPFPRKMGRVDGHNPHIIRKDLPFTWTNVYEDATNSSVSLGSDSIEYEQGIYCDRVAVYLDQDHGVTRYWHHFNDKLLSECS